jgi:AraC-like DNA-binding protein
MDGKRHDHRSEYNKRRAHEKTEEHVDSRLNRVDVPRHTGNQRRSTYFIGSAEELLCHFEKGTHFFSFHFDTIAPTGEEFFFNSGLMIEEPDSHEWIDEVKKIFSNPQDPANVIRLKYLLMQKIVNYLPELTSLEHKKNLHNKELFAFFRNYVDAQTTLADLAKIAKMSSDTLSRSFSKHNGITIKRYLDHSIAARASKLLRDPSLKVKEIAQILNFQNEYYFSRFFKRETNQTPTEFRKNFGIKH